MIRFLLNVWWLVMLTDGVIAFVCARGFWLQHRGRKSLGSRDAVSFWTAVMLACFAFEALTRAAYVGIFSNPECATLEGVWAAVVSRAVKSVGMWLWWLRAVGVQGAVRREE